MTLVITVLQKKSRLAQKDDQHIVEVEDKRNNPTFANLSYQSGWWDFWLCSFKFSLFLYYLLIFHDFNENI